VARGTSREVASGRIPRVEETLPFAQPELFPEKALFEESVFETLRKGVK